MSVRRAHGHVALDWCCRRRFRSYRTLKLNGFFERNRGIARQLPALEAQTLDQRLRIEIELARVGADDAVEIDAVRKILKVAALERLDFVEFEFGARRDVFGRQADTFARLL
jgi:hypothetical protein